MGRDTLGAERFCSLVCGFGKFQVQRLRTTNSGCEGHTHAFTIDSLQVQRSFMDGLMCRSKSELNETIHRAVSRRNAVLVWLEIFHFTDDLSAKFMLTEQAATRHTIQCCGPRSPIEQVLPECFLADAYWRDDTQTSDHNSAHYMPSPFCATRTGKGPTLSRRRTPESPLSFNQAETSPHVHICP